MDHHRETCCCFETKIHLARRCNRNIEKWDHHRTTSFISNSVRIYLIWLLLWSNALTCRCATALLVVIAVRRVGAGDAAGLVFPFF